MIKLNLQRIAKKRGIEKIPTFLIKHGIDKDTAKEMNQGRVNFIRLDKLEKLCEIFKCEPYDILEWHPGPGVIVEKHPLRVMLPKMDDAEIKQILTQLPMDKLDELLSVAKKLKEGS